MFRRRLDVFIFFTNQFKVRWEETWNQINFHILIEHDLFTSFNIRALLLSFCDRWRAWCCVEYYVEIRPLRMSWQKNFHEHGPATVSGFSCKCEWMPFTVEEFVECNILNIHLEKRIISHILRIRNHDWKTIPQRHYIIAYSMVGSRYAGRIQWLNGRRQAKQAATHFQTKKRNPSVDLQATNSNLCHCTMFFRLVFARLIPIFYSCFLPFYSSSGAQLNVYNCHKNLFTSIRIVAVGNVVSIENRIGFCLLVNESIELVRH